MRSIILFITLGCPLLAFGQNDMRLGQGIINIAFEKKPTITFYYDTLDKKPQRSIQVIKDKSSDYAIKNRDQAQWFAPEGLWLDYSIFIIRVDTVIGKWYSVFINDKQTMWTKADAIKKFKSWKQFLLTEVTSVVKRKGYELHVKDSPANDAKTIKAIEIEDCFQILEVKGDWIKIKTHEVLDCDGSKKKINSGWIQWRQNNHLTIEYGLTC